MWDTDTGIVAGTTSVAPSPYHTWNIGGAWDHIFTPNLILEAPRRHQCAARGSEPDQSARPHSGNERRLLQPQRDFGILSDALRDTPA